MIPNHEINIEDNPQVDIIEVENDDGISMQDNQHEDDISSQDNQHADDILLEDNQHADTNIQHSRSALQRELSDAIVRLADIEELKLILKLGVNVNLSITQGLTPLHYAVWQRYREAAELLIKEGCDINVTDDIGYSPLHLASEHGYLNLVELLLKNNARVNFNSPDPSEQYPMDAVDEPLRLAIKNDHYDVARLLLEHGANPNSRYFFGHEINLINPFNSETLNLLLSYGADPNAKDRQSFTPLMKACRLHQGMESVLLLLTFGADVNLRTDARHDYRTVLHYAVLSGSLPIVNLLLKQGANVNFEEDYQKPTPLDLAILKGDVPMIKLLIEAGVDVNASSPVIGSPLHVACADNIKNRLEVMQLLLESGANPNQIIYNEDGKPLRIILGEYLFSNQEPEVEVISLLLRYGAEVIMQNQNHDPRGILNDIPNLMSNPKVLIALLEAAQCFDMEIIKRSSQIDDLQRKVFLKVGDSPMCLKHIVRISLRKNLTFQFPDEIQNLMIPKILKKYLLYEIS